MEDQTEIAVIDIKQFNLPEPTVFKEQMEGAFAKMYEKIDADLKSRVVDLTTDKGRKQIASDARKISTLKVRMVEKAGELVADQKAIIETVTKTRQAMEAEFDKRRDAARAPLTKWEETVKQIEERAKSERNFMLTIRAQSVDGVLVADMTGTQIEALQDARLEMVFSESLYGEAASDLWSLNRSTIEFLGAAAIAAFKAEDEAKELEELRAMRAEKLEQDARAEAERIAAEEAAALAERQEADRIAAEKAEAERKAAEEKRIKEQAEADAKARVEAAQEAARVAVAKAEVARIEAEDRAAMEKAEAEARHERELEAAKAREEAAAQAERDRLAADRKAEADARAKREADQAHRAKINGDIATALRSMSGAASPEQIADALMSGKIPHCEVRL